MWHIYFYCRLCYPVEEISPHFLFQWPNKKWLLSPQEEFWKPNIFFYFLFTIRERFPIFFLDGKKKRKKKVLVGVLMLPVQWYTKNPKYFFFFSLSVKLSWSSFQRSRLQPPSCRWSRRHPQCISGLSDVAQPEWQPAFSREPSGLQSPSLLPTFHWQWSG